MRESAGLSRHAPMRRLATLGLVFVAAILSCGKDVSGPLSDAVRYVRGLAFAPVFPPAFQAAGGAGSGIVAFSKVHVVLHHSDGTVALDTTIDFPAGADSLTVDLTVKLLNDAPSTGEPMSLNLGYLNSAGVVVFEGGPVSVTAAPPPPGGGPNPPVKVPVSYTGPGATATSVVISPRSLTQTAGGTFSFTAVAKDANGTVMPGTPIIWAALDPSLATVTSPAAGSGVVGSTRGTARIQAQLLTGPTDEVIITIVLPASQIIAQSGNAQTAVVGTTLPQPLVVKVAASDGVGVAGTTVNFAVASGGGSLTSTSAVSDASGLVQTNWKLGTGTGSQSVTATASGMAGSPLTFTATAQAATATKLVVTTQPVNGVAGTPLTAVVITAQDNNGNVATGFTGPVALAFGANSTGATLSGTSTVNAVAGVATFSGLTVNKNGTAYTLVASSSGLSSATTNAFDIALGAPNKLVFTVQPADALVGAALTPSIVVTAEDSQGNTTPSFTGAVTLSFGANTTGGVLGGTLTQNAVAGVATFAGITVSAPGTGYTLTAAATGLASATSALFNITAPPPPVGATHLVFVQQPTNAVAGVAIAPAITVAAKDASNVTDATYTGNVTITWGTHPLTAVLSGTTTVAAVAGVATFNNLSIQQSFVGYAFIASSGALTSATSANFTINAAAATTIAVGSGQGQSGATSSALPLPIGALVTDAFGNPVAGVTVNFATAGGGTLSPASATTSSNGIALSSWTLGATPGPQTATATSGVLTGSPVTFNASATVSTANIVWTGLGGSAWTTAASWSPAVVPGATDSVFIPAGGTQPIVQQPFSVKHLYAAAGSVVNVQNFATITISGNLDGGGAFGGSTATINLTGTGTLKGALTGSVNLTGGTHTLNGALSTSSSFTLNGGSLVMNGQTATIAGNFATFGASTLTMTNAADVLNVFSATFGGGGETGLLTAGTMTVNGNFTQNSPANGFDASGTHTVVMAGVGSPQSVNLTNPATSRFQNLSFTNTSGSGANIPQNILVQGNLTVVTAVNAGTVGVTIGGTLTDPSALLTAASISFMTSTTPISATTHAINSTITFNNNPSILAGDVAVNGAVNVNIANLQLNGHHLMMSGNFVVQNGGQLTMTNAADSLYVGGNATFGGGVEAGILTAGKMVLNGSFAQNNAGNGQEFKAVAGHQTILTGSAAQTISFANPDTTVDASCSSSCFGDLTINKSGGTVTYATAADHRGTLTVMPGVASVTATSSVITVHGSTVTPASTAVHFAYLGTFGSLALDPVTLVDTLSFDGTAAQTIATGIYTNARTYIRGTPTVGAGGFSTSSDLIVSGGNLTMGGHGIVVGRNFVTTANGTLTMNAALDSLFVTDTAQFSGGGESGLLTNGALVIYHGMVVSGAGQFAASAPHTTYLLGSVPFCVCDPHLSQSKSMTRAAWNAQAAKRTAAFSQGGFQPVPRAVATQRAAATRGVPRPVSALRVQNGRKLPLIGGARPANSAPLTQSDSVPLTVSFGSPSGNQFGNLRILGTVDWQSVATVSGNVALDTLSVLTGTGHLTMGGTLTGRANSSVQLTAFELSGTGAALYADSGVFSPDTTVWSGTNQVMPGKFGGQWIDWWNVVVNSATLSAVDTAQIYVGASLFVPNSGRLHVGSAAQATSMSVNRTLETHQSGTLQMNDNDNTFLYVSDSAWFDGGSTSGLLTHGEIQLYSNFKQSGSTTSFAATSPHETYLSGFGQTVTFASPGVALSHFGDFYDGDSQIYLKSDVFANGQLESGLSSLHQITGAASTVTSMGADIRHVTFDSTAWVLNDGYPVTDMDSVSFIRPVTAGNQFTVSRNGAGSFATMSNWTFATAPIGGKYISATDTDGATNGVLTLAMSNTNPGSSSGLVTLVNGALITGWSSSVVATWTGGGLNGLWTNTANWDIGSVPTSAMDIVVNNTAPYLPSTGGAVTVHNLTVNAGATLTVTGANMTVNGDISVAPGAQISLPISNVGVNAFGNVATDTAGTTGLTTCAGPSSASMNLQAGIHTVTGKFCNLSVFGTYTASGPIAVTGSGSTGGLQVFGAGSNLTLNGNHVIADHFSTATSGTLTMNNANDSLTVASSATFTGGATTGLLTAGHLVISGATFSATGLAFDASGTHTVSFNGVSTSVNTQTVGFASAVPGHGFQNLLFQNSSRRNFSGDQWIMGTLTFDVSNTGFGTDGSYNIHVKNQVDNSPITGGSWNGSTILHMTGNGTFNRDTLRVNTLEFDGGGTFTLTHNLITNYTVVDSNSTLSLGGHRVDTQGNYFYTQHGGVLGMTTAGDSLIASRLYFNGGSTNGSLTAGGINVTGAVASEFFQGYDVAHTVVPTASATSFAPTGTRVWFNPSFSVGVAFANPGTGAGGSHFWFVQAKNSAPVTLRSDVFVDSLLVGEQSGATWTSDSPGTVVRTVTAKGIYNLSSVLALNGVAVVLNDGAASTLFNNVTWSNFPSLFTGNVLTVNRSDAGGLFLAHHDFSAVTLGVGGHYLNAAGSANINMDTTTPFTATINVEYVQTGTGVVTWPYNA